MKAWDLSFKAPHNEINAHLKLWNMAAAISEHKMMRLVLHVKKKTKKKLISKWKISLLGENAFRHEQYLYNFLEIRKLYFRNKLRREKCSFQARKGLFKTAPEAVLPLGTGRPGTPPYTPRPGALLHLWASLFSPTSDPQGPCVPLCVFVSQHLSSFPSILSCPSDSALLFSSLSL